MILGISKLCKVKLITNDLCWGSKEKIMIFKKNVFNININSIMIFPSVSKSSKGDFNNVNKKS